MTNTWNNNQFQQGLPTQGQVKLFDPSQFQSPVSAFGGGQPDSKTQNVNRDVSEQHQNLGQAASQDASSLQTANSSWNTWGSWDWNSGDSGTGRGHQTLDAQGHQTNPVIPQQQQLPAGNQYYDNTSHTTNSWNQGWDAATQFGNQNPPYGQQAGNAPFDPSQQHQQYEFDQGQYTSQLEDGQQQQVYDGQFYNPQQQQPQTGDHGQTFQQGQGYFDLGHKHYQGQVQTYYDQPFDANAWNPASGSGHADVNFPPHTDNVIDAQTAGEENAQDNFQPEVEPVSFGNIGSIAQPVALPVSSHESSPGSFPQGLDVCSANDGDGTVSGFFGRDQDGDAQAADSTGGQGRVDSSGPNQFLSVEPTLHRTNSEISNASLSTLNMSNTEEDNMREPLHSVHELVQRMEEVDLSREPTEVRETQAADQAVGGMVNNQPQDKHSNPGDQSQQLPQNKRDYSVNSSTGPDPNNPPPTLPLDSNPRSNSPDQPGSSGSGASGGSSGMADWEIVPSQAGQAIHSGNSSPDNVSFFSDKPDGGVNLSSRDGGVNGQSGVFSQDSQSLNVRAEENLYSNLQTIDPTRISSAHDTSVATSQPSGALPSDLSMIEKRSGSPFIQPRSESGEEALTDSTSTLVASELPPTSGHSLPPTAGHSLPPKLTGLAPTENPFKRKDGKTPRHTDIQQHTSQASPFGSSANKSTSSESHPEELHRMKGIASLPSKPKVPYSNSSEDGNRASRRDSDTNNQELSSARLKQGSEFKRPDEPYRANSQRSQDSVERETSLSSQQRRPHSAFHPVSRPRQTAMSPATTLWDDTERPATNILLAPAMPLIIPSLNTHSSAASSASTTNPLASKGQGQMSADKYGSRMDTSLRSREGERRGERERGKDDKIREDKNRSFDSLDELDSELYTPRDRAYRNQRTDLRDSRYKDSERPVSRSDRPYSRGNYQYDRPISRTEGRDDRYGRYRGYYRDYGDNYYDERYDRPRSRQDEGRNSRPSSRSNQDMERPRSRADYDRDRDYQYREKTRDYGYDSHRPLDYLTEERERYYRYYREKEARYNRGYYEEYYGANPDYYNRGSRPSSRNDYRDYNRDYYRDYRYEGYNAYYDGYGYDPYAYGYGYTSHDDSVNQSYDQGRLTPPKYSYPHVRACFGPNGQLVKIQANRPADGQPAIVEVQDVQSVLETCPEAEELKTFPGPLTRVNTHKKDVLLFCQEKAKACIEDVNMTDRESAQLIWKLLELLIKQNGSVVGTDLSDLLLEGHEPTTHEYSLHGMKISQSPEVFETLQEELGEDSASSRNSPAVKVTSDRTVLTSSSREREGLIDRFRHLLLYGRKKDALECAMRNNLWGHALFLASKMDTRTHANVMTRFANSAMRMNDPLQTLYQLMSGRQPAAVTCVTDERWGDWRPHLAMILSNQTSRHDLDRKSISSLGDTLATKGCLHASHFCYLMAQASFGNYKKKTSKVVLIGSNHNLSMEEFASNETIQCTEVFEYARSLGNSSFCLPHFQVYKYLYASRLADYGMTSESLHYLEVISYSIQQSPAWFQPAFVRLVHQLASRLKFSDPQRLHASEDADDPVWIQQLEKICGAYEDGTIQPASGTATPANFPGTGTSSESGDYNTYTYSYGADAANNTTSSLSYGTDTYGNQQLQQMVQPDNSGLYLDQTTTAPLQGQDMPGPGHQTANFGQEGVTDSGQHQTGDYGHQQMGFNQQQQQQQYDYSQWQGQQYGYQYQYTDQQQQQAETQGQEGNQYQPDHSLSQTQTIDSDQTGGGAREATQELDDEMDVKAGHGEGDPLQSSTASQMSSQLHGQGYVNFNSQLSQQSMPRSSLSTEDDDDDDDDGVDHGDGDGPASGFDYFGTIGQQKVVAPPHRYRTMSNSSTGSTRRRRTTSGSSTGSVKAAPQKSAPPKQQEGLGTNKKAPQQGNGGWLGGLFSKFSLKGKNEMILPDDKNPPIVWDPVKKKWINEDGTDEADTPAVPPPKDTELIGKPPSAAPSSVPPPSTTGPGSNRFSLKAKGARNQYVDVNNPKPVSVPSNLFNLMPTPENSNTSSSSTPQMFLPGSNPTANTPSYNTNNSGTDSGILTAPSSGTETSSTDPAPSQQTANMPMLFNPASLSKGSGQTSTVARPGLKYGQRRSYPK